MNSSYYAAPGTIILKVLSTPSTPSSHNSTQPVSLQQPVPAKRAGLAPLDTPLNTDAMEGVPAERRAERGKRCHRGYTRRRKEIADQTAATVLNGCRRLHGLGKLHGLQADGALRILLQHSGVGAPLDSEGKAVDLCRLTITEAAAAATAEAEKVEGSVAQEKDKAQLEGYCKAEAYNEAPRKLHMRKVVLICPKARIPRHNEHTARQSQSGRRATD